MPAMHAKHPQVPSFDRFGGVLVEAVGPVATQARHRESTNLYLRGGLHIDGTGRGPSRLKLGELFARRNHARVPHDARAIVVHWRCQSVDHSIKLGTFASGTRAASRTVQA